MKNREAYLQDLLVRLEDRRLRPGITLPEGVKSSSHLTVAHEAHQEINNLSDEQYIPVFQKLLETEKRTINKINLIAYLIRLADKLNRVELGDYVLDLVAKEKTRWVNDVSLRELSQSKLAVKNNRELLFELVKHKDWQIKLSALDLLKKLDSSYSERIEEACLEFIKINKKKPHELSALCGVLSRHGSTKSVEAIKEIARTNSKALAVNAALTAIGEIDGKNQTAFFIEIFESNRNNDVKSTSTQTLCEYGNEKAIPLLVKRAKSLLSKARTSNTIYVGGTKPELVHIFEFLQNNHQKEADQLFKFVEAKKMAFLDETERKWFEENIKKA
ncbi:MAG: hypothetical protein MI921_28460 [Cytophagales bacterium]|nr:hypothetical protein [Cytophagales bacterium]